jgi:hypothetical protein
MIVGIRLANLLNMPYKPFLQKTMKNLCESCIYFDAEKHKNDPRTAHAGICKKWCEIVFKNDKECKQYFSFKNAPVEEIFPLVDVTKLPPNNQLTFFN